MNMGNNRPFKILIIRMSSIGDIVLTFPFIRLLRKKFPEAQIDFVVKKEYRELIEANKNISNIFSFDSQKGFNELKKLKGKIKKERYKYIFDIHRNLRSYYLRKFSKSKKVFLYKKYRIRRWLLIRLKLNFFKSTIPVYKSYINSAKKIGLVDDNEGFDFLIDKSHLDKINEFLRKENISGDEYIVGICPGAGYERKCWTIDGFSKIGKFFAKEFNATIVILGDENDHEKGEMIREAVGNKVYNFCGELSIMESSALVSKCNVIITNDNGLMHIAVALNKKLVAIFGATVEEFGYFPVNVNSVVVQRMVLCRPCSNNGWKECYKKNVECMRDISPEDVKNACLNLIGDGEIKSKSEQIISEKWKNSGSSYIYG
jgi:heptosyltransferase-2